VWFLIHRRVIAVSQVLLEIGFTRFSVARRGDSMPPDAREVIVRDWFNLAGEER
jgi:hypothetical protein